MSEFAQVVMGVKDVTTLMSTESEVQDPRCRVAEDIISYLLLPSSPISSVLHFLCRTSDGMSVGGGAKIE